MNLTPEQRALVGTEALNTILERTPPDAGEWLLSMLEHYRDEFRRFEADPEINSESIADSVHREVDEQVDELLATDANAHRVVCRRGCCHCCYLYVTIDRHEAALLLLAARMLEVELDWDRIERQAGRNLLSWRDLPHAEKACAFLGDEGECRVHDYRPTACRKYLVLDTPELCDTARHPGATVAMLATGKAEAIASAALAAFPRAASLPRMLMIARQDKPRV